MEKKLTDSEKLRKSLSSNIKKYRKTFGLSQEKLAEAAGLSFQTINDIEGCRMWVSDKSITKLAQVLQVEAYQLLIPEKFTQGFSGHEKLLALENKLITVIHKQFRKALET